MIIYYIYKYTTHPLWHSKDLGPVAYKLSPTQRQNRASLLPIRAHEYPEAEEMTAYRGQHGGATICDPPCQMVGVAEKEAAPIGNLLLKK